MAEKSLLQFILDLLRDPEALEKFQDDPKSFMNECGLGGVSPEEVYDTLAVIQDNDDVSFDRDYNTGGNHAGGGGVAAPPPPPPAAGPGHHDPDAGVKYLDKYITNNYVTNNIDDRDTIIDQSVNQNIDTGGGDFRQDIDNNSVNATGDGAVAAGGDISGSTITTGDDNVVGDRNQVVKGDDNAVAFGSGSANRDVTVGEGGAFSGNGPASVDNSTTDASTTTNVKVDIDDSFQDNSDNSIDGSFNNDASISVLSDDAPETADASS